MVILINIATHMLDILLLDALRMEHTIMEVQHMLDMEDQAVQQDYALGGIDGVHGEIAKIFGGNFV